MAEHVVFAGERRDVGPVLSSFDLLVAASAQETFGLAMLEALGTGLPLLYTTCPALDGIVTDLARQVPGEEAAMRRALAVELDGPSGPRLPVEALVDRYGIDRIAARIDNLYDRLRNLDPTAEGTRAEEQGTDLPPSGDPGRRRLSGCARRPSAGRSA